MEIDVQIRATALARQLEILLRRRILQSNTPTGPVGIILSVPFGPLGTRPTDAAFDRLEVDAGDIAVVALRGTATVTIPQTAEVLVLEDLGLEPPPPLVFEQERMALEVSAQAIFASRTGLATNGPRPTSGDDLRIFTVRVRYTLGAAAIVGGPLSPVAVIPLTLQPIEIIADGVVVPRARFPQIDAALRQIEARGDLDIPPIALPLDGPIASLNAGSETANPFVVRAAGLRALPDCLTIRIEIARPNEVEPPDERERRWRDFLVLSEPVRRLGPDGPEAADWGIFLPEGFFAETFARTIEDSVAGDGRVQINSDNRPRTTWSAQDQRGAPLVLGCASGGRAAPRTHFSVKAPGVCLGLDIDVNVRLDSTVGIEIVDGQRKLRVGVRLDHSIDEGDAILCAWLASAIAGGAFAIIGATIGGWIGAIVGGIVGALAGIFGVVGVFEAVDIPVDQNRLKPLTDSNGRIVPNAYYMDVDLPNLVSPDFGLLAVTSTIPCVDGLTLAGRFNAPPVVRPTLAAAFRVSGFSWHPRAACPPPGGTPVVNAYGLIPISGGSATQVVVYHLEVLDSTPEDIQSYMLVPPSRRAPNFLEPEFTPDGLFAARAAGGDVLRYTLLMQTNAGARIFEVVIDVGALSPDDLAREVANVAGLCRNREALAAAAERLRFFAELPSLLRFPPRPLPNLALWRLSLRAVNLLPNRVLRLAPVAAPHSAPLAIHSVAAATFKNDGIPNDAVSTGNSAPRTTDSGTFGSLATDGRGRLQASLYRLAEDEAKAPIGIEGLAAAVPHTDGSADETSPEIVFSVRRYASFAAIAVNGDYRDHAFGPVAGGLALAVAGDKGTVLYLGRTPAHLRQRVSLPVRSIERVEIVGGGILAYAPDASWRFLPGGGWQQMPWYQHAFLRLAILMPRLAGHLVDLSWARTSCGCRQTGALVARLAANGANRGQTTADLSALVSEYDGIAAVYHPRANAIVLARLEDSITATPRHDLALASVTAGFER